MLLPRLLVGVRAWANGPSGWYERKTRTDELRLALVGAMLDDVRRSKVHVDVDPKRPRSLAEVE